MRLRRRIVQRAPFEAFGGACKRRKRGKYRRAAVGEGRVEGEQTRKEGKGSTGYECYSLSRKKRT